MAEQAPTTLGQPTGDVSLARLIMQLWERRWTVAIFAAVFIVLFGTMAFLSRPVFRATTWLMSAESQRSGSLGAALGSLSNLAAVVGIDVDAEQSQTQEALAVLRSRAFRESFIADLGIMPQLLAARWRSSGSAEADALETLQELIVISRDPRTTLYSVQVEWTDPAVAANWANTLVDRVNAEMRTRALQRSTALIDYLEKELTRTDTVQTREAISRLLEAQINERMFATVTDEYAFMVVERAPVPDRKVRPRRGLQLMVGAITGGFMGMVYVLLGGPSRRVHAHG